MYNNYLINFWFKILGHQVYSLLCVQEVMCIFVYRQVLWFWIAYSTSLYKNGQDLDIKYHSFTTKTFGWRVLLLSFRTQWYEHQQCNWQDPITSRQKKTKIRIHNDLFLNPKPDQTSEMYKFCSNTFFFNHSWI